MHLPLPAGGERVRVRGATALDRVQRLMPRIVIAPLVVLALAGASADVPVPERVLNPPSAAEAWNVIRLATENVERLIEEKRPLEIAEQISLCSPALRVLARATTAGGAASTGSDPFSRAYRSVNLIARESLADNLTGAQNVFAELKKALAEMQRGFAPAVVKGEIYHCLEHPETIATKPGSECDRCGRALRARRIPYSVIYVKPGKPTLKLTARVDAPLKPGSTAQGTIQLHTLDGQPVALEDLLVTHTRPIHLLLSGPDQKDFHHAAAAATATAGEFRFAFTPALPGSYRLWAGVVPAATGLQEYLFADLPAALQPPPAEKDEKELFATAADGLKFQLFITASQGFAAREGRTQMLRIDVADADGKPVRKLEPLMNAFAHLIGFYADGQTVVQLHPTGGDILRQELRGGPSLTFKFYAPKAGLLKLYCQVRVDGREIVAPLAIRVRE